MKLVRPYFFCFGLVVLLLAQLGAVYHEVGHVAGAQRHEAKAAVSDAACALCPAFAQVTAPALGHSVAIAPPAVSVTIAIDRLPDTLLSADKWEPRSRGPPRLI